MAQIRKDKLGREPQVGSFICYNPPSYKGLIIAKVVGFTSVGLPMSVDITDLVNYEAEIFLGEYTITEINAEWTYAPRTGFVVIKDIEENEISLG